MAVKLEQALINYALDFYSENSYQLYTLPELVQNTIIVYINSNFSLDVDLFQDATQLRYIQ